MDLSKPFLQVLSFHGVAPPGIRAVISWPYDLITGRSWILTSTSAVGSTFSILATQLSSCLLSLSRAAEKDSFSLGTSPRLCVYSLPPACITTPLVLFIISVFERPENLSLFVLILFPGLTQFDFRHFSFHPFYFQAPKTLLSLLLNHSPFYVLIPFVPITPLIPAT